MLTTRAIEFLESRGIEPETASRMGVTSEERHGIADWISFPFLKNGVAVNHKYRKIKEKAFEQDKGGEQCFWNYDCLLDETLKDQPIIITEGEFDALAAIQCGFSRSVSVPSGAPQAPIGDEQTNKYNFIHDAIKDIGDCKEIILAVDMDSAGSALLQDLSLRLGKERCKWVKYPKRKNGDGNCKDINETLVEWGEKGVKLSIEKAQWMQTDGVYSMGQLAPIKEPEAFSLGFLGDAPYKIRKGDFCVVTGIPSHGKSSFLNDLACRMADKHGWKTAFASFEQTPQTEHRRNLRSWYIGGLLYGDAIKNADAWIDEHFRFIVPSDNDDVTIDWVLSRCAMAVVQHDCDMIIIDPWNEMDHRRNYNESLTEYVGNAIKSFKRMAKRLNIHLIVAAHPTKLKKEEGEYQAPTLYDISDSAHWANKADIGLSVHRPDKTINRTIVTVLKIRYQYACGEPNVYAMVFDKESKHYELE